MAKTTQHVIPSPKGGWSVKKGGAEKATKSFSTKDKAVDYAKRCGQESRCGIGNPWKRWEDPEPKLIWK